MNKVDKLSRDAKILVDSANDTFVNAVVSAVKSNDLALSNEQLAKILKLANFAASEGYQKALRTFQACAVSILAEK